MKIGDFFIELGLFGGEKAATTVGGLLEKFKDMKASTVAGAASLTELVRKFQDVADEAFHAALGLEMFEAQTGLSSRQLQMWQHVGEQAGITAQGMAASITTLQRNLAELRMGRGNFAPFQLLGISANQDAFEVLSQLRTRIKELGLDQATATNLISQMGLSPDMINLLRLTDAEFKSMVGTAGVMTGKQARAFLEGEHALVKFHQAVQQTKYMLVETFGPLYTKMLNLAATLLSTVVGQALALASAITAVTIAMIPLGAAIWTSFAPFLPVAALIAGIVAGIAALILVLEDLYVYSKGGNSVFGELIQGFDAIDEKLRGSRFGKLLDLMGGISGATGTLLSSMPGGGVLTAAPSIIQYLTQNIDGTGNPKEVAQHSAQANAKAVREAVMQTNQQGY